LSLNPREKIQAIETEEEAEEEAIEAEEEVATEAEEEVATEVAEEAATEVVDSEVATEAEVHQEVDNDKPKTPPQNLILKKMLS